jgi:hypothetical protein
VFLGADSRSPFLTTLSSRGRKRKETQPAPLAAGCLWWENDGMSDMKVFSGRAHRELAKKLPWVGK